MKDKRRDWGKDKNIEEKKIVFAIFLHFGWAPYKVHIQYDWNQHSTDKGEQKKCYHQSLGL
jgi:hypothetical protein